MGHIVLTDEGGEVTSSGGRFLSAFGADLMPRTRRIFCQPCLDWSERRYHLKGLVGARILDRLLELGWLKCVSGSRVLRLTSSGRAGLSDIFQIEIEEVVRVLACAPGLKARVMLTIGYGRGLRGGEVTRLKVRDIDSA